MSETVNKMSRFPVLGIYFKRRIGGMMMKLLRTVMPATGLNGRPFPKTATTIYSPYPLVSDYSGRIVAILFPQDIYTFKTL